MGVCPIREALQQTRGRKARNALLQTIQACKQKKTCNCWGVDCNSKEKKNIPEKLNPYAERNEPRK
jgi:hypothetical protein